MRSPRLVSVIVPAYDPGPELGEQLAALAAQDYEGPVEILVADNGARRGGARTARRWIAACPGATMVDATRRRGPGAARNLGARAARGDFLAFCDADDRVSTSWLRMLVASAADADLVGGSLEPALLNSHEVCACYDRLPRSQRRRDAYAPGTLRPTRANSSAIFAPTA